MVNHILADGRKVKSIEGMVVPPSGKTAAVYNIVAGITMRQPTEADSLKGEKQSCENNKFTQTAAAL